MGVMHCVEDSRGFELKYFQVVVRFLLSYEQTDLQKLQVPFLSISDFEL